MINSTQCSHVSQWAIAVSRRSGTLTSDERLAWFTLRHKHKHNECSNLLHKHEESDIRKRNELQNEAVGVWARHVFKMAEDEILPLLLMVCRCQILFYPQFSYHGCIYF